MPRLLSGHNDAKTTHMNFKLIITLPLLLIHTLASGQNDNLTLRSKLAFPGQTVTGIWGYSGRDGKEYALVGTSGGLIIVDVSNPDNPQQIVQIPMAHQSVREVQTFSHYAYMTTATGASSEPGLLIVDLKNLPATNLDYHIYTGDGEIENQLGIIHTLHVDRKKDYLYLYGSTLFSGGAIVLNLHNDPYHPEYAGNYSEFGYIHDGFVENDTLYAAHIGQSLISIVDMHDKSNPELITTVSAGYMVHNTWLSEDHKTLFASDESGGSGIFSYDISDFDDIRQHNLVRPAVTSAGSTPHNLYVYKSWLLAAWYRDGFFILDATIPEQLTQVAHFDNYEGAGSGFQGCWSVYPYLPSGNLLVGCREKFGYNYGELYIFTPTYQRASYLKGQITDAQTGFPINNVKVEVLGYTPATQVLSKGLGQYGLGIAQAGGFKVRFSKSGYQTFETFIDFTEGITAIKDVVLYPSGLYSVTGFVLRQSNNQGVNAAEIRLFNGSASYFTTSQFSGAFSFSNIPSGAYDIVVGSETQGSAVYYGMEITSDTSFTFLLTKKLRRDALETPVVERTDGDLQLGAENPFCGSTRLQYTLTGQPASLKIYQVSGQLQESHHLSGESCSIEIGQNWLPGVYIARFESSGDTRQKVLKLVKKE